MSSSGVITGVPTAASPIPAEIFVTVTDADSQPFSPIVFANLGILISNKLTITPTKLPAGYTGVSYSTSPSVYYPVTIPATGGSVTYTFAVVGGSLPPGLTLVDSASGVAGQINGAPTAAGTFTFTVEATDSSSPPLKATANFSITVVVDMIVTPIALQATIGVPFSGRAATVTGGTPPYKFLIVSGGLSGNSVAPGLELLPDGTVEGTPAGPAGTYVSTIEVHDSGNPTQVEDFTYDWDVQ
jgi:large repetitive protein